MATSVPAARHAVADFAARAGAAQERVEDIVLVTSEAVSNAVQYAYGHSGGSIVLEGWLAADELWLVIADEGVGLQAGRASTGLGLGLALIAQLSDHVSIHDRAYGGTELRMTFDVAPTRGQRRGSVASATRPASPVFSTTR
jgi:anti-sigma regulatory factor (Ser/Thr protein kinase)